ncbi:hypothetical protein [Saccharothrix hoggarensis]|uniref:Uncharacterized protein n=1 Tax=Saccharothrix hoggarensis TaxID=913853 RepID=A0ABW3R511_9PSEU
MSRRTGLPVPWLWALALLGVPRVVAHDLRLVGPVVNAVLVFAPIAVWLAVVLWRRVPNPFLALLVVGACHGVLLAVTHQLLWAQAFAGTAPDFAGGQVVLRISAALSSLVTGTAVGAVTGAVGWVLARLVPAFRPRRRGEES